MDLIWSIGRILLGVIALGALAIWFLQDRLLFFPQPLDPRVADAVRRLRLDAEAVAITAHDGARLHGWFLRNSSASKAPALIYFGGNAEEVSGLALDARAFGDVSLLLVNYRGYGGNEGAPGEAALFADALALYDFIAARPDVDPARIGALGRSLGSGVAIYLATQRPVRALVLVTPYDSIAAVARRHYPFLPVSLMLRHPFDSSSRAPDIRVPALIIAAGSDQVIPPAHARALAQRWGGPVNYVLLDGADHDNIDADSRYWPLMRGYLRAQEL